MHEFSLFWFVLSYIGILYSIALFLVFLIFGFFLLTAKSEGREILTFRRYVLYSIFWPGGIPLFFHHLKKFEEKQSAAHKTGEKILPPDVPYFGTSKNKKRDKGGCNGKHRPYEP